MAITITVVSGDVVITDSNVTISRSNVVIEDGDATTTGEPDLVLDWDTGDISQWTTGSGALEAGAPAHQSTLSSTVRRGPAGWSHRFEVHNDPGDIAANSFRSLLAKYDSQEGPPGANGPSDFAYAFSFRVAQEEGVTARLQYSQIWELHHRANMYSVPGLSLAPHAVELYEGDITYRLAAGAAVWDGSAWTGWSTYLPQQLLRADYALDTWYDLVIRIKCSEGADGVTQVWCRAEGEPWPAVPQFDHAGPTLPYVPAGLDPNVPVEISTGDAIPSDGMTGLYLEAGLYTGSSTWYPNESTQQQIIYMDGMRRYPTAAAAMSGFPPEEG
jgi:hypothetical protein